MNERRQKAARAAAGGSTGGERRRVLGSLDLGLAVLLIFMIWGALPARWWPVDVVGTALALLLGAAGLGFLQGAAWSRRVGIVAGAVASTIGAALATTLAFTAAHLSGLYGPVGQGGALLLFTVALLVLPYLVALPAAQLFVLTKRSASSDDPPPSR